MKRYSRFVTKMVLRFLMWDQGAEQIAVVVGHRPEIRKIKGDKVAIVLTVAGTEVLTEYLHELFQNKADVTEIAAESTKL